MASADGPQPLFAHGSYPASYGADLKGEIVIGVCVFLALPTRRASLLVEVSEVRSDRCVGKVVMVVSHQDDGADLVGTEVGLDVRPIEGGPGWTQVTLKK
jgi:hypothetical protein